MENAISYFATVASLVLAVIAIWLSLYFYKQSNTLAESTKEAAKEIKSGVERLEKLFDKLYEGTFSMMKETVSDMRKHMWPDDAANAQDTQAEIDKRTEEKLDEFRQEMSKEVANILEQQKKPDDKIEATKEALQRLVEKAISGSIEVEREVKEENIRDAVLKTAMRLSDVKGYVAAFTVVDELRDKFHYRDVLSTINEMAKEGDLVFKGIKAKDAKSNLILPDSVLEVTNRGRRALARRLASPE